jgi:hypothetical protein
MWTSEESGKLISSLERCNQGFSGYAVLRWMSPRHMILINKEFRYRCHGRPSAQHGRNGLEADESLKDPLTAVLCLMAVLQLFSGAAWKAIATWKDYPRGKLD